MSKLQTDGIKMVQQAASMKRMDAYNKDNIRFNANRLAKIRRRARNKRIVTALVVSLIIFLIMMFTLYPTKTETVTIMPSNKGIVTDANRNQPEWLKGARIAIEPGLDPVPDYIGDQQTLELIYSQNRLDQLLGLGSWRYKIR